MKIHLPRLMSMVFYAGYFILMAWVLVIVIAIEMEHPIPVECFDKLQMPAYVMRLCMWSFLLATAVLFVMPRFRRAAYLVIFTVLGVISVCRAFFLHDLDLHVALPLVLLGVVFACENILKSCQYPPWGMFPRRFWLVSWVAFIPALLVGTVWVWTMQFRDGRWLNGTIPDGWFPVLCPGKIFLLHVQKKGYGGVFQKSEPFLGVRYSSLEGFGDWWEIPLWPFAVIATSISLLIFLRMLRLVPQVRTKTACMECGYDLRATPARCPECGTQVVNRSLLQPS